MKYQITLHVCGTDFKVECTSIYNALTAPESAQEANFIDADMDEMMRILVRMHEKETLVYKSAKYTITAIKEA